MTSWSEVGTCRAGGGAAAEAGGNDVSADQDSKKRRSAISWLGATTRPAQCERPESISVACSSTWARLLPAAWHCPSIEARSCSDAVGYSASKGAIISLTRDLAVKWARHGIRVNAIAPGFFETRLTSGTLERSRTEIERSTPMGRIGRPGELQGAALFLASPASAYVTGHVLVVDGGTTAR